MSEEVVVCQLCGEPWNNVEKHMVWNYPGAHAFVPPSMAHEKIPLYYSEDGK